MSHDMSSAVRPLTVLGEFKPFGLIAEALDGKLEEDIADRYDYWLFDPEVTRERDEAVDCGDMAAASTSSGKCDHELFIRGNRIIWTAGSRVYKRFTLQSPVIKACWCRLGNKSEALLCVLQIDTLTIYNITGDIVSVPLTCHITSIWPLPFGLLLQRTPDRSSPPYVPFSSSSSLLSSNDIYRLKRDFGHSPQYNLDSSNVFGNFIRTEGALVSSHLILKDPLEEPQSTFIEERGRMNILKEFDEKTIWTSNQIPLLVSYNKGKMQHSLWVAKMVGANVEAENGCASDAVPPEVLLMRFTFRRIWQGKGVRTPACKVFLATDDDAVPLVCFLIQEQKKLLSVRLQSREINNEVVYDINPDISWSISAIAAAPVIVTRPRVITGVLPFSDIIVLTPENTLLLYSGKQCLCKYVLPSCLGEVRVSCSAGASIKAPGPCDYNFIGLADAVEERINVIVSNGKIFRCALRRSPFSSLVNDCITAFAEGLSSDIYNHILVCLWGDENAAHLFNADSTVESEWESFSSIVMQLCKKPGLSHQTPTGYISNSSWEFLMNSKFHKNYHKLNCISGVSSESLLTSNSVGSSISNINVIPSAEKTLCPNILVGILDSLHAVYESLKLHNLRRRDLDLLVVLLCDISCFLGENCFLDHYIRDFPCLSKRFGMLQTSNSFRAPPSIFRWLETCLQNGCDAVVNGLPYLICKDGCSVANWARKIVSFYSLLSGAKRIGKRLSSGVYCNIAVGSTSNCEELTVLAMVGESFGLQQLDLLPGGVSLPLRHALDKCRESPPTGWPEAAYVLLGREDLALSCLTHSSKYRNLENQITVKLISMSTPYMLHLHPVTVPSTVPDITRIDNTKFGETDFVDGTLVDGMEHIFNSSTKLRYGRDLRLNEVRNLMCSARPVAIHTPANSSASDLDLQQAELWQLAQRTTALPLGRGAFTLATICTLLTEALAVPKLVLAGRLLAQQNAIINLDPSTRNLQELTSWAEFHNAVAAGLRVAPFQGKVSRTWIIYNKPQHPNVIHAGLLLSLGLHGHLRSLTITDIYQYFSQEHEYTTVGLMLGLAASYRGTMQPAISKSLFFHIPSRYPSSYPELEFPTLLQSAALLSVGLLYEGLAHPQTMQFLLGEIGRRSGGDNVLEREGYAVSAGFSLGLVALGRGEDAAGFMDSMVNRLFQFIGRKEFYNESVLIPADEQSRGAGQMMDATPVNVDVTAPGAIIALALIYLKTESDMIVSRLSVPETHFDLQYVRPDFIMLRVIARNLIMWSRVHPSKEWIQSQVPGIVRNGVMCIQTETDDIDEMDAEVYMQAYVNIVAGACVSLGLRFAGTKDGNAQELLYEYAVYFIDEVKPVSGRSHNYLPKGLSRFVDRGTLETCLHLIVLSLSLVMAGTGHLETFRLLKFLRSRKSADGYIIYGTQMAVSLAIGFLFLGGGMRTFSTSNSSVAALFITLYPRLPIGPNDNRCHLQAFRHLYVLATEARWIQTADVDTGLPVYAPLEITIKETEEYAETSFSEIAPCILPERSVLKSVRVCGPRYWPRLIELTPESKPWWIAGEKNDPFNSGILYIKRKVGACSYVDDPVGCQSLLSRAMHKVFGSTCLQPFTTNNDKMSELTSVTVDQLVSIFSSDPSLIAFAQLCCDPSWNIRSDVDFKEFCLQVLFECVGKDRPALLQVYLSLYTTIVSMALQVNNGTVTFGDSLFISSLKLVVAYNNALLSGRLTALKGGVVQSTFIGSLRKRVEDLLKPSCHLKECFLNYLSNEGWPIENDRNSMLLSWYLQWFDVPAPAIVKTALEKFKPKPGMTSLLPLLRLALPRTHIDAICEIDKLWINSIPK